MEMMDDKEDNVLCKINDLHKNLRLRKDYKESVETHLSTDSNNGYKNNDMMHTSQSTCVDDSILEFKSPKKALVQSKNVNSNGNRLIDKSKQKTQYSKSKIINNMIKTERDKRMQNKKTLHDIQQPSIESSFFKSDKIASAQISTNMKTAYVCPLCFKNLKDESTQAIHMKSCAIKNNVTTKKLIDAVELQERQAAERKSLGLLSAPILQDKKKSITRKMTSHEDPDLQLALALSKSLYEKEEMEKWDEAEIIATMSSSSLPDSNEEHSQKITLQNFGFTSNKSVSPVNNCFTSKIKRRKPIDPTILQRRTTAERERILTDRIAEVLLGYKDFTQRLQEEEEYISKQKIVVKNQFLQQLHQTENTLWDRTRLMSTKDVFYVAQLSPHITLHDKQPKLNEDENFVQFTDQNINDERSLNKEQIKVDKVIDKSESNIQVMTSMNTVKTCCREKKFLDTLAINWGNILNDSSASDIIVLVQNERYIWAHKLVFYVRCSNILLDVTSNDTTFVTAKEKLCWIDIDYNVALAFLEFVYCGAIYRYSKILDCDTSLCSIRSLARKYKINDLFVYLRQQEFKSKVMEIKQDYNTCEQNTDIAYANVKKTSNDFQLNNLIFNASDTVCNDMENFQYFQKIEKDVNIQSSQDNHIPENFCVSSQDEEMLVKSSDETDDECNTSVKRETNLSPDMFDDTPDIIRYNDKRKMRSKDHEDLNIHVLLNLIKEDTDIDNLNQTSFIYNAKHLKFNEDISTSSKNVKQDVMEIDLDADSNSIKPYTDSLHEDLIIEIPQISELKYTQDYSSNLMKQKSNLTLFIEKMQKENAKSDSDLDSDTEYPLQISPIKHKNPFYVNKRDSFETLLYNDNIKQSADIEKKQSKLSMIEQRMQSDANKNPEFYSRFYNEQIKSVKRSDTLDTNFTSPENVIEISHNNIGNYIKNLTSPIEKNVNIAKQITATPPSTSSLLYSPLNKIIDESSSTIESISNLEADEKEISMYSKYMRNHKDNSIAKYRRIIKKNLSDSNLFNESTSSNLLCKTDNINKSNKVLNQSVILEKDADVIVSSDTEESYSENTYGCPVILQNDSDRDYISFSTQQCRKEIEGNKQDIENQENNQLSGIKKIQKTIATEEEKDANNTRSNRDKPDNNIKMKSGDVTDFSKIFTQTKCELNESHRDRIDDHKENIPSPITVPSSPDFLNSQDSLIDERRSTLVSETDNHTLKKSSKFSFDFEHDIYLANVDTDKYDRSQYNLEKSRSVSVLNVTESKKDNMYRSRDKSNHGNITNSITTADDKISDYTSLRNDAISLTHITSIKKFKRKSLSEGQINTNKSYNQETTPKRIQTQFQYSYNQNIKTRIIDKDVTPPPDYVSMRTPELHKEMKKYGLKIQKRSRAVKLLTHIYNELHPLIPATEVETRREITEISSDDEGPPPKRPNTNKNNSEKSNTDDDNYDELLYSQDSNANKDSVKNTMFNEMEFYETESLLPLENSSDITEAFTKLINVDKNLHNKILRYEPVNIEQLRSTLQAHGFKCKLANLMSFLDEHCITFYIPEQSIKSKTRRKI